MEVVLNHLQPGPDGHAAVYTKHLKGIGMEHPREVTVLVVGGGGRCHAIVDALSRSPQVGKIYCAPGNAGIAAQAECVPLKDTQVEQLRDFALEKGVDLTVVGPEVALAAGITDAFTAAGLRIFGPTKAAAVIESSKDFAKQLMAKYNVPTAAYRTFEDYNEALEYVSKGPFPVVLKYDGLAAGKGVVIPETLEEADHTLRDMLLDDKFGKGKVVVEEFLTGPEFSFMCFVDGERVWPMALSQDHKRAYEGDKGPNTGGMGAYSPLPFITEEDREYAMEHIKNYSYPNNQVEKVSSKRVWYSRTRNPLYNVVCVDCGCKLNIIRKLNEFGCNVIVVPFNTTKEEILKYHPDGLFLSNGPGDPENVKPVIELVKYFKGKLPILGICLGHQIIGLAYGAKTYKMKFGHRGANHPVKDLETLKVEITSQNHSFAVDKNSLEGTGLKLTHINILDGEAEGMKDENNYLMCVQYHPESAAGPEDSEYLFGRFRNLMKEWKAKCQKEEI